MSSFRNASSIKWTKGGEGIDAKVTEKIYSTAADCTGTPSSTNKFSIVDNSCSTKQMLGIRNNQYCESIAAKYKMSAPGATSSATAISTSFREYLSDVQRVIHLNSIKWQNMADCLAKRKVTRITLHLKKSHRITLHLKKIHESLFILRKVTRIALHA